MKVAIEKTDFLAVLTHMLRVPDHETTDPILENVHLRAANERLEFKTTNLEMEVTNSIKASVVQEGRTHVSVQLLYDIVHKLPKGVQISLENSNSGDILILTAGSCQFNLPITTDSDYPEIGVANLPHKFQISALDLKSLIDSTLFVLSDEEPAFNLKGIFMHIVDRNNGKVIRSVTTDGNCLALSEVNAPDNAAYMPDFIIPKKTAEELQKLLESVDDNISVELSQSKICIKIGQIRLNSKLIESDFLDYTRVIPTNNDKELKVDKHDFSNAIERVSSIRSDYIGAVKLSLFTNLLELSYTSPLNGTATEDIEIEYGQLKMQIGFSIKYLFEITSHLKSKIFLFKLSGPNQPAIIQNCDTDATLYVVMPMDWSNFEEPSSILDSEDASEIFYKVGKFAAKQTARQLSGGLSDLLIDLIDKK